MSGILMKVTMTRPSTDIDWWGDTVWPESPLHYRLISNEISDDGLTKISYHYYRNIEDVVPLDQMDFYRQLRIYRSLNNITKVNNYYDFSSGVEIQPWAEWMEILDGLAKSSTSS